MFVINTAAEIGGAKHNYELAFPTHPSIEELKAEGAAVFSRVADKPITVGAMQIYDSRGQEWVDLLYESQILNHCQVFVYQDVAPGVAVEAAVPFEEKTGAVFQELSRTHRDLLTVEDFVKGLQALRLDLSDASLSNLFHRSDCDNDGYLSVTEFLSFSTKHPTLLEAAYQRCIDMYKEQQTDREVQLTHHKLQTLAEKGREKREALRAAETFEVKNRTTLHSQIGALAIAQERDREASDRLVKTTESVDMATHALEVKKQDLQTARDEERKTCCRAEEADLELASAVALMEQSEQATTRASGNVKALETELMLQKEELQKCMDEQQRCSGMHAAAETRKRLAKEALARASEFSSAMASEVITAENDLKMLGRREQDATAFARASSIEAARELATHEMIKSSMAEVRQQRELLAVEEVEARREQAELLSIKREHEAQSKRRVDRRAYDDLKEMHLIEKELAKDYYPSSPSPVPHTPATKHHSPTRSPATSPGLVLTEAERAAVFRARTIAAAAAASTTPQPQVQPQLQHSYTRLASPVVQTTPSLMLSPRYRPVPIW